MKKYLFFFVFFFLFNGILFGEEILYKDNLFLSSEVFKNSSHEIDVNLKQRDVLSMNKLMQKIHSFKLKNGMTFVVMERKASPVVSFVTFVKVGSVDEPTGHTGIAHIFEHMAFKGTKDIGTKDWHREKILLEKLDNAYRDYIRCEDVEKDKDRCLVLKEKFHELLKEANSLVKHNEFSKIIEKNGGEDLNAGTATDYTLYYCSLPANKVELWFSLESDRLKNPVFREFYTEKEVIREERRMRVDTSPMGKLLEAFRALAFVAHPYKHPTIGWDSDIVHTTIRDVKEFYKKFYIPQNITIAIVGDVNLEEIKKLAHIYFSPFEKRPDSPYVWTKEPKQRAKREVVLYEDAHPMYIRGYHVPGYGSREYLALELLEAILSSGRSSRLYSHLVLQKKLALSISAFYGFPGERYPTLFGVYAIPNNGVSLDELGKAIDMELKDISKNGVSREEIDRAYTMEEADLLREMDSNLGMARELAYAQSIYGDWKKLFSDLSELKKVSSKDIQEVVKKYFVPENMIEAKLIKKGNSDFLLK